MLSSPELEHLLQHTKYRHFDDDDSDNDQDTETSLPLCLPTPILLVTEDDAKTRATEAARPLPLAPGSHLLTKPGPLTQVDMSGGGGSQSENNISDSPTGLLQLCPPTPPPYTPADTTRVAAEVDCCSAIEKTKVKTVMCLNYMHGRRCRFGAHCAFAHGVDELRQAPPEMMAKKQALVCSSKPPVTATPPPSYLEALASTPLVSPELGATPAYADAVREQREHLPPPPPTDLLPSALAQALAFPLITEPSSERSGSSKQSSAFSPRQRSQGSGGNVRDFKAQPRRLKRSPV